MRPTFLVLILCAGCAVRIVPTTPPPERVDRVATAASPLAARTEAPPPAAPEPGASPPGASTSKPEGVSAGASAPRAESPDPESATAEDAEDEDEGEGDGIDAEDEAQVAGVEGAPSGPLYTAEISDEELARQWKDEPKSLGSVSVGFVNSGRLVNAVRFPEGADWIVVSPEMAWATEETVEYLARAIREVRVQYPKAPPLRVNQMSAREGGYLRSHRSHQNGRDVDLGFYYQTAEPVRVRARERYIDPALNWALVRALVIHTDVQMILVDRRIQKVLYEHALRSGEDKAWLDSLFHAGERSIVRHARRHRDHFHVRFYNPRAQELGHRLAPMLALQPEQNVAMHRIRSGDTLGAIARRYGSSISAIQKANRMKGTFLRVGRVLSVPLRGPCTQCPVPPPVVVPPRRLPATAVEQGPVARRHRS